MVFSLDQRHIKQSELTMNPISRDSSMEKPSLRKLLQYPLKMSLWCCPLWFKSILLLSIMVILCNKNSILVLHLPFLQCLWCAFPKTNSSYICFMPLVLFLQHADSISLNRLLVCFLSKKVSYLNYSTGLVRHGLLQWAGRMCPDWVVQGYTDTINNLHVVGAEPGGGVTHFLKWPLTSTLYTTDQRAGKILQCNAVLCIHQTYWVIFHIDLMPLAIFGTQHTSIN